MKNFKIPVEWTVYDYINVQANSLEDALKWVKANADDIPLGTTPDYAEGSWKVSSIEQDDINKMADELRDICEVD